MLRFQKRLQTELGPEYDCLHCRRAEQNLPEGCPTCPRTYALEQARLEAGDEFRDVLGEEPDDEALEDAEAVYHAVRKALDLRDGKLDPAWSISLGMLARVVHYEERRAEFIEHWDHLQEMKRKRSRRR